MIILKSYLLVESYTYRYRPGYGSKNLLLEFVGGIERESFVADLLETLSEIKPVIDSIEDLWMNDEILFHITSQVGEFLLSIDIWELAFILGDSNQKGIKQIETILSKSNLFTKEKVNFDDYK